MLVSQLFENLVSFGELVEYNCLVQFPCDGFVLQDLQIVEMMRKGIEIEECSHLVLERSYNHQLYCFLCFFFFTIFR